MKYPIILAMTLFIPGIWQSAAGQGPSFTANGKQVGIDTFNKRVDYIMNDVGVPGLSLAVISNDRTVFYNTYGYKRMATKERVDKQTIFEACSLSKSFLVFAVYRLVNEHRLDLDKPMYQYLPFPELEGDPRYKLITPRMILGHCSGIENWRAENNPDSLEILSDPGTNYVYSGEGYRYLARVVELIESGSYESYITKNVLDPLKLGRTFLKYDQGGEVPVDYAYGHDDFGKELKKGKNLVTEAAGGIHTTASDYGTLIVSLFNDRYVSPAARKELLTPVIKLDKDNPSLYYGPGFEILFHDGDTIIAQGGNNKGFKAYVFYSVPKKCGLVFFTNGDLGKLLAVRLADMALGLNVDNFFIGDYYEQYPNHALSLLKTYREKNAGEMLQELETLKKNEKGAIGPNTLNQLADIISAEGEIELPKKLLEDNIKLYPSSATAFYLLGELNMDEKNYKAAYTHLKKAMDLSNDVSMEYDVKKSFELMNKK